MRFDKAEVGQLEKLLSQVGSGLDEFLKFEHRDAFQNEAEWRNALHSNVPQEGVGIEQVSREIVDVLIPNGASVGHPGFTSYITTGPTTVSTLAVTAAGIASPQRYTGTAFNFLEDLSLDWMAEMFGLGPMKGLYSSGGSVANLIAMGAARQSAFEKLGHDPAKDGINRAVSIYASRECHHTIQRSGGVLGVGRKSIRLIGCDSDGRMLVSELRSAIEDDIQRKILPMAIVANAGTTNTGAIDPISEIVDLAREFDVWVHVDGAYGLPGILDSRIAHLYDGIDQVDSVIVDPHKWLGASVGVAATFVRDRGLLERAFTQEAADYLEGSIESSDMQAVKIGHSLDDFGVPYFNYGVELSAPCRGVVVWGLIKEIGVEGMRERICRHNDMAADVAARVKQHPNLELLLEPSLSVCCFRYISQNVDDIDLLNQKLHRQLVRENEFMPSTTRINGKLAIRPCFLGARTDHSQLDDFMESISRIGKSLVAPL